jgi:hypothetical protein
MDGRIRCCCYITAINNTGVSNETVSGNFVRTKYLMEQSPSS